MQTNDYGYVFQPNVTDPNWAPYTDGHWVYTDDGWTWASDEPWGWATYHYGRWVNLDGTGWVWVPGYTWAPAWVSWRYGGDYCGWAPLPPDSFLGAEYGDPGFDAWATFHFGGDVDVSFNIGPGCYNFVRGRRYGRARIIAAISSTRGEQLRGHQQHHQRTPASILIARAAGATGFREVAPPKGPPINEINAHARQRIQTAQLTAANQPGQSRLQGNSLAIYAPRVNGAAATGAKPARVSQTLTSPTVNRGNSITKPLEVTASVRPPPPTAEAIQAAQAAQHSSAPAKARIATENTTVKTPLTKPLTSLQPAAPIHTTANTSTAGANGFNGAKTVNPNAQHPATSPFTGESVQQTRH